MTNFKKLLLVGIFVVAVAFLINGLLVARQVIEVRNANGMLKEKITAVRSQNELLEAVKLCTAIPTPTPWPQPNPKDPICGDPSAFSTPLPEAHH